ncbi:hypothetical protein ABZ912_32145 [Nonomuraea angiospora]|uniref:hypothetical protein n=1 Tax=Nonomuraea angiospora TaxID=46172 RepID=UPI0033F4025A
MAGEWVGNIEPIRSGAGRVVGWQARRLSGLAVPRTSSRYARTQEPAVRDLLADLHARWEQAQRQRSEEPESSGEEVKPPLTQAEIAELVRRYVEDLDVPVRQIAADFDVSEATVYRIAVGAGAHRQYRGSRSPRVKLTEEQMADLPSAPPTRRPSRRRTSPADSASRWNSWRASRTRKDCAARSDNRSPRVPGRRRVAGSRPHVASKAFKLSSA